jgi:prephenate dehydrogenase
MYVAMTIGIYGLGRFGTLWSQLLSKKFEVKAYNRTRERNTPAGVNRVDLDELLSCDVLFLCVAISALEEVLETIRGRLKPGCLVADTCSVKVYPTTIMKEILPENINILGTHPMFGPDSARYGVEGLPIVLSPERGPRSVHEYWRTVFTEMGLHVIELSPEQHDREAAYTQGITHFIGRVLEDLSLSESTIGTRGFEKLLEIIEQTCNDPWQLFLDLQLYNPYTKEMRVALNASLNKIMEKLE